jgi:hypothetical protein
MPGLQSSPETMNGEKVLRAAGLALLVGAVAIDALAPVLVRWRRAVAAHAIRGIDTVAPSENVLLDVSIGLLQLSDRWRR